MNKMDIDKLEKDLFRTQNYIDNLTCPSEEILLMKGIKRLTIINDLQEDNPCLIISNLYNSKSKKVWGIENIDNEMKKI